MGPGDQRGRDRKAVSPRVAQGPRQGPNELPGGCRRAKNRLSSRFPAQDSGEAAMDLEGNLILERTPARRWVSIVAVVIPVVACVAGVTWFVRAFISPPTIAIPGPMMLATAPSPPPTRAAPPAPAPIPAAAPASSGSVWPAVTLPPTASTGSNAPFPPTAATPAAAPSPASDPAAMRMNAAVRPNVPSAAFADPTPDRAMAATPAMADPASAPIMGPVPMPRPRPQVTAAATATTTAVPIPRARPAEEEAKPASGAAEPDYSRHTVN